VDVIYDTTAPSRGHGIFGTHQRHPTGG